MHRVSGWFDLREATDQTSDRLLAFEPSQRCPQAVMDAAPERDVFSSIGPPEVKLVGLVAEFPRISVGRTQHGGDELAGRDGVAGDLYLLQGDSTGELNGAVEAEQFLDGVHVEAGVCHETVELVDFSKRPFAGPVVEPWQVENAQDRVKTGTTSFENDTAGLSASNPAGGA